ncbi:MAG: cytochrome c biogenesis protein ResB [Planctomycetia bacterium]|nr:cytochrome c biogenesis protein ResB [Planctomycetia bacterium]
MSKALDAILMDNPQRKGGKTAEPRGTWDTVKQWLRPISSLKLTVVLFGLCMVLVLAGTLAQVDSGIQSVVAKYFRSMSIIWIPLQVFFPRDWHMHGSFPFPGGWLLGLALLVNLLAAHVVRFRVDIKRIGIWMIHVGVILLIVGELVTGLFQVESRMDILVGSSANFVYQPSAIELAMVKSGAGKEDQVAVIPEHILKSGQRITHPDLPLDVVVDRYMSNSEMVNPGVGKHQPLTAAQWAAAVPIEKAEVSGADPEQIIDAPSAYITLKKKGSDESLGKFLVSIWLSRQDPPMPRTVIVDGQKYDLFLRFKREYKPYTLSLLEFKHTDYEATNVPQTFSSLVRLEDPTRQENRKLKIWMNHPLRHAGESFYQADFRPDDMGTVLQVVRNPGWLLPYISCTLVGLGMLVHFGILLVRFLRRSLAL